jgi:hypothetical protein
MYHRFPFLIFLPFIFLLFNACTKDDLPTCGDGIQNGGETGIDCGGPCRSCLCFNGIKDEGEECIDCGGDCFDCPKITGRYVERVFDRILQYKPPFVYKRGITEPFGNNKSLDLTFYEPEGDTILQRPLVIMMGQTTYAMDADGSFFTEGINYVGDFVLKGYVIADINGIRHWEDSIPMATEVFDRTAMRISADCRSAVRFFKSYASLFRIDTTNIWLMGASMGAMASLHAAYIDEKDLTEMDPKLSGYIMEDGGIKGNDNYVEYSSSVKGVISLAGMIFDAALIDQEEPYLLSIIGKEDQYRPFGCEMVKVNWIEEERLFCGPTAMLERMQEEGFQEEDYLFKLTDTPPADHYAPFDPAQCPECANEITEFIASKLGYCK